MSPSTAFEHLKELHEKYARHDLRGMWQREGSNAPKLPARGQRRVEEVAANIPAY